MSAAISQANGAVGLVRYDEMCRAIQAAYEVDEVLDIKDKARAIELYMQQQHNVEAERRACEIRLRAERKLGQMLKGMEKIHGARGTGSNQYEVRSQRATPPQPTLSDLGISKTQSSRWQKLAEVPDETWERTFAQPEKPSTTGIIAAHEKATRPAPEPAPAPAPEPEPARTATPAQRGVHPDAIWVWGRLLDFERMNLLSTDPASLAETMEDHMREVVCELAPRVCEWLQQMKDYLSEE